MYKSIKGEKMSSKDLIKITKELTGLKLQIVNNIAYDRLNGISTCIKICPRTNFIFYIMINLKEVRKLSKTYLFRRLGIKSIYLKTLLHEIAHIKQVRKFKGDSFMTEYDSKSKYYENMADRYARLNYKKVLIALDKQQKVCYIRSNERE